MKQEKHKIAFLFVHKYLNNGWCNEKELMVSAPAVNEFHNLEWSKEQITLGKFWANGDKRRYKSPNLPAVLMNMGPADYWTCNVGHCHQFLRPPSGSTIGYKNLQKQLYSHLSFIIVKGSRFKLAKGKWT